MILNKYNKNKQQNEKDQPITKSFDIICEKSLQDNLIDKSEYESLCNTFTKFLHQTNNEFSL